MQRAQCLERVLSPLFHLVLLLGQPNALCLGFTLGRQPRCLLAPAQLGGGTRDEPWPRVAVRDTCAAALFAVGVSTSSVGGWQRDHRSDLPAVTLLCLASVPALDGSNVACICCECKGEGETGVRPRKADGGK